MVMFAPVEGSTGKEDEVTQVRGDFGQSLESSLGSEGLCSMEIEPTTSPESIVDATSLPDSLSLCSDAQINHVLPLPTPCLN